MEHLPGICQVIKQSEKALAQPWRLFRILVLFIFMGSRLVLSGPQETKTN